jgi:hypothetical protein
MQTRRAESKYYSSRGQILKGKVPGNILAREFTCFLSNRGNRGQRNSAGVHRDPFRQTGSPDSQADSRLFSTIWPPQELSLFLP